MANLKIPPAKLRRSFYFIEARKSMVKARNVILTIKTHSELILLWEMMLFEMTWVDISQ